MKILFLSLFFFICLFGVFADYKIEDGVYVLTEDNFDEFVNGEEITVVEFYAPWCGHCKKLTPEYAKASKILAQEEPPIKLAKVDTTIEKDLGTRFEITGYPTLKFFRKGIPSPYDGPRDSSGIVKYIKQKSGPNVKQLDSILAVEKFTSKQESTIVYFGENPQSELFLIFKQVATDSSRFGFSHSIEVAENFGITGEKIVLFQPPKYASSILEEKRYIFSGSNKEDLLLFIREKTLPLAGEFNADNQGLYANRGLPVVKLYIDVDWEKRFKQTNYFLNRLRQAAKKFPNKFSFTIASSKTYSSELNDLGISKVENPIIIHDLVNNLKYREEDAKFSTEALEKLCNDYVEKKLEPYIKSEQIPENNDGDVKIVVAKNFNEIVLDPTKDVLLESYAPWCGHCKKLEPIYKELGNKLKKFSNTLTIAKVDATANDLPSNFATRGYPTIFFVPANKKNSPITFDGQKREIPDLISFIQKHAYFPLDFTETQKDEL